jgi:hypothetical protein
MRCLSGKTFYVVLAIICVPLLVNGCLGSGPISGQIQTQAGTCTLTGNSGLITITTNCLPSSSPGGPSSSSPGGPVSSAPEGPGSSAPEGPASSQPDPGASSAASVCGFLRQIVAVGRRRPACGPNGLTPPPDNGASAPPPDSGASAPPPGSGASAAPSSLASLVGTFAGGGQTLTIAAGNPPLASFGPPGGMISPDTNPYDVSLQGSTVTLTQVNGKSECFGILTITYTLSSDGKTLTPQSLSCGPPTNQSQNPGLPVLTKQ